ncbi:Adiponectin receptor protein 1-like isoform X2 [Oopsacas minuta]|uniref:Adiponectin receptor protein 1-like isoform X2 n=1 Tax=Oopsacas minuta TaxID=111878 RepID=A0AAV7KLL9_9METZ|nr:Adiponectin receptor protein 1-like isoform X2 [Oopsacas minuta]
MTTVEIEFRKQEMKDLLCYNNIPSDNLILKDNPYILKYHRPPTGSFAACVNSMKLLHCETANFWTHFLPAVLAVLCIISNFLSYPLSFIKHDFDWDVLTTQDRILLSLGVFGITVCFGTSSMFHVFCTHSRWSKLFNQFDLMAVMFMLTCLAISISYFKFANTDTYLVIAFELVVGTISIKTVASLTDANAKGFRVIVYSFSIFLLWLPCLFSIYLNTHVQVDYNTKNLVLQSISCAILGGIFYASKIPEKILPGYFDLIGSSHMWMHVFTSFAAFYMYEAILMTATFRYELST